MIENNNLSMNDEFIDLLVNECLVDFRKEHEGEYKIVYDLIMFFRKCEEQFKGLQATRENVFLLSSIVQLNKLFQSAVIVFERGLKESGDIIIRSIMELVLKVISVIRKENFLDVLLNDEEKEKKKVFSDIKENKYFDIISEEQVDKMIQKCNENIDGRFQKSRVAQMAKDNDLDRLYILYRVKSAYTHQSSDVVAGIVKDTDGGLLIDGNFQLEEYKTSIALLISIVIPVLQVITDEFLRKDSLKEERKLLEKKIVHVFKDVC